MLRIKLQKQILDLIKESNFTIDDFEIDFIGNKESDPKELTTITFKHEQGFFFSIEENIRYKTEKINSTTTREGRFPRALDSIDGRPKTVETREQTERLSTYDFRMSPGNELALEILPVESLSRLDFSIERWLKNLSEDLSIERLVATDSTQEQKQKVKDALAKHLEPYIDDRNARFNKDQISDISAKMEQLVISFHDAKLLMENEIAQLKVLVEEISKNLEKYKKGTWYETTLNRFSQWVTGVENVDKLIGTVIKLGEKIL
ncbi:hypothetical protein OPW32_23880 [Vibrio europaeus]|uniref:hypothetical protein n=1 Tax=Vibrio europaeus TaxID=300876 RepID=UPI0023407422|nr:hypothetical protein [Vibrio europaeus]MDC5852238.1 hypothetical protein [Vibrio europaeus]